MKPMKRTPKARMAVRRDRFVVGYLSGGNIVFGRASRRGNVWHDAAEPMTRLQAERLLRTFPCSGAAIFELVPIKVNR